MTVTAPKNTEEQAPAGAEGNRLSPQTLIVASLASAAAAILTSMFWKGGTVLSAAITPIVVSLVSEVLNRPAARVAEVSTKVVGARRARVGSGAGDGSGRPGSEPEASDGDLSSSEGDGETGARVGAHSADGPGGYRVHGRSRRRIQMAVVTGVLAFVIAAVVLTVSEQAAGGSATGGSEPTLLSGGSSSDDDGTSDEGTGEETDSSTGSGDPADGGPTGESSGNGGPSSSEGSPGDSGTSEPPSDPSVAPKSEGGSQPSTGSGASGSGASGGSSASP